jgi:hypothetical protein
MRGVLAEAICLPFHAKLFGDPRQLNPRNEADPFDVLPPLCDMMFLTH